MRRRSAARCDGQLGEYDTAGNLLRRYVYGASDGTDDPLVWFEGSGVADAARRYLFADERGSIGAVTDANGNKLAINAYDEYGIPDDGSQGSIATKGRFRYTGQTLIPELGMYYCKARMYSPTLGRFMQTDPIGYDDQVNLYGYVANDPVNSVDPTGTTESNTCTLTGKGSACAGDYPGSSGSRLGISVEGALDTLQDVATGILERVYDATNELIDEKVTSHLLDIIEEIMALGNCKTRAIRLVPEFYASLPKMQS